MARKFLGQPLATLPAGEHLCHGTSSRERFRIPDPPAWFSDSPNACTYFERRWEGPCPRTLWYRTTTDLRLVELTSRWAFDRIGERLGVGMDDPEDAAVALCAAGASGWIVPNNYQPGDDIMLCNPASVLKRDR